MRTTFRLSVLLVILIFLTSCVTHESTAPAAFASAKLEQATEANEADFSNVVNALFDNLVAMYSKQLQLLAERELVKINQNPDPVERAAQAGILLDNQEIARTEFMARVATARINMLNAPNFKLARRLASGVREYIGDIDATAKDIDDIIALFNRSQAPTSPPSLQSLISPKAEVTPNE